MTKEEKKEYAKEYYRRNKEKINAKSKERYHKKTGSTKYYNQDMGNYAGTIDELKGGKRYYIPKNEKRYLEKKQESPLRNKHKGFKFSVDGGIVCMEVISPFRIMEKTENGVMRVDNNAYRHLQCELRRRVANIEPTKHLIIVDDSYIQVYMRKDGNIDAVVEIVKQFIMEQTKIYGKYKKRGRYVGAQF